MLSYLSLLLLASSAIGSPYVKIRESPISVPIAAHINTTGTLKLIEADRARAKKFFEAAQKKSELVKAGKLEASVVSGVPATNAAVTYTVSVGIGIPPTQYILIVDTGSSNLWIGANQSYIKTSTSMQTPDSVMITTGGGTIFGTEYVDEVTLAPDLVVHHQSIAVVSNAGGFQGVDGGLGLGPTDLTLGTLSPDTNTEIPTVTDNLFAQGTITAYEVAISFEPTNSLSVTNGVLTFGGTNSTKFSGPISFFPRTGTFPASEYWGLDQSIRYGTSTNILSTAAGIVDTGTTLVLIATNAFNAYKSATGGVLDAATGLIRLTPTQFANLKSLFFVVSGVTYEFTANAQAWPRNLNSAIGGGANSVYLIVGDIGAPSGQGLDFINGFAFLERFYSVYDSANARVGLAQTPFTFATTN